MNRILLALAAMLVLPAAMAQASPISLVPQDPLLETARPILYSNVVLIGHHHWGHHRRHHHHGRRFGLFFFPGPYYDYGTYRPHRGCYWRCRHWHSPRWCRHRCY
jgi:hypothetical protein